MAQFQRFRRGISRFANAKVELAAIIVLLGLWNVSEIAGTHYETGTVVAVGVSKQKVIIAADSRVISSRGQHNDVECKISTLGDKLIFAAVGKRKIHSPLKTELNWDAHDLAVKLAGQEADVRLLCRMWAQETMVRIIRAVELIPDEMIRDVDDAFVRGLFVGISKSGEVQVFLASILLDKHPLGAFRFDPSLVSWKTEEIILSETMAFDALGRNEIARELLYGNSDWAKEERRRWEAVFPPHYRDRFKVVRLVELTIALHPRKHELGGPIDVIELRRGGKIRWIRRKPECKDP